MTTTMTKAELQRRGAALFGEYWFRRIEEALDVNYSTTKRWRSGEVPVPVPVIAIIELLETLPVSRWPDRWRKPLANSPALVAAAHPGARAKTLSRHASAVA